MNTYKITIIGKLGYKGKFHIEARDIQMATMDAYIQACKLSYEVFTYIKAELQ